MTHGVFPSARPWRTAVPVALLALLSFVLVAVNLSWISLHRAPPTWDEAFYLSETLRLFRTLVARDGYAFLDHYVNFGAGFRPPLIGLLTLPLSVFLGSSFPVALFTITLLIPLMSLFLYLLARQLGCSPIEAILSVIILSTMPVTVGLSRAFFVDYPLMLCVTVWLYCLLKSSEYQRQGMNVLLGVVTGFGLLLKTSFPVFVALPALAVLRRRVRRSPRHAIRDLGIIGVIAFLVAGTWWAGNFFYALHLALQAAFSPEYVQYVYGKSSPYSLRALLNAFLNFINNGVSVFYGVAAVAAFATLLSRRWAVWARAKPAYISFLLQWFLPPFLLWMMSSNRQVRYALPALPAIAIVAASFLTQIARRNIAVLAILVALPLYAYLHITFGVLPPRQVSVGPFVFLSSRFAEAMSPNPIEWPVPQMVAFLQHEQLQRVTPLPIFVLSDTPYLNSSTFNYYALLNRSSFTAGVVPFGTPELLPARVQEIPYILVKDAYILVKDGGYVGYPEYAPIIRQYAEQLKHDLNYQLLRSFPLPDGSQALMYRHR